MKNYQGPYKRMFQAKFGLANGLISLQKSIFALNVL